MNKDDERLAYTVEKLDPRIHFALVCASSSCPPISFFTAENLDKELIIACKAFLNGGGFKLQRLKGCVSLSRIFKWYADDFGSTPSEILKYISSYLYDDDERAYVMKNADRIKIEYQDYDWRLNRY